MPPEAIGAQQIALRLYTAAGHAREAAEVLAALARGAECPGEFTSMALAKQAEADELNKLATHWLVVAMEATGGCDD